MKRTIFNLLFLCLGVGAWAQSNAALDRLKADPRRAYGTDYPYQFNTAPLTKAPKGYKPFYISHYGRHGSRYYWNEKLYKNIDTLLTKAHTLNQLTAEGEAFRQKFMAAKKELNTGWSELTQLGWEQHQGIARRMYNDFPQVFRKGGNVLAVSSLVGRCVISMSGFCQELVQCNPKIEIREQSSRFTLNAVVPTDKQNPDRKEYPECKPRFESNMDKFKVDTTIVQTVLSRVFTTTDSLTAPADEVVDWLSELYTSLPSIDHEGMMGSIISDQEVADIWEYSNLGTYSWLFSGRYIVIPIIEDIIQKADDVLAGRSDRIADLRFGHDSFIGPLTVLLGINGADLDPEDPYEVKNCYQSWETCMASNIQLVFYRGKKSADDILVKLLLNGEEATLPVPTTQAPYYRWSDFRQYYKAVCDSVKPE